MLCGWFCLAVLGGGVFCVGGGGFECVVCGGGLECVVVGGALAWVVVGAAAACVVRGPDDFLVRVGFMIFLCATCVLVGVRVVATEGVVATEVVPELAGSEEPPALPHPAVAIAAASAVIRPRSGRPWAAAPRSGGCPE